MPKAPFLWLPPVAALMLCMGLIRVQGPVIPQGREPGTAPYDPFARGQAAAPAPAAEPAAPGFRITVPICRRAQQQGDPLARTPECAALLRGAEDQARACRQAFAAGDDASALSPACRQAAGFR